MNYLKQQNFKIDGRTLEDLEWYEIKKAWSKLCESEQGRKNVYSADFASTYEEAEARRNLISEIRDMMLKGIDTGIGDRDDVDTVLNRIEVGGVVKSVDFYTIIKLLDITLRIYDAETENYPEFNLLKKNLNPLFELKLLLSDTIDEDGEVKSSASSELYGLRKRKIEIKKEITKKLDRFLKDKGFSDYIQDTYHTTREGRYVIPVKSEFRSRIKGNMHGVSASGQTVYIEPGFTVSLNDRISEIDTEIEVEEFRILTDLARSVVHELPALRQNSKVLTEMDTWRSAALLAEQMQSETWKWAEQTTDRLYLRKAKHPIMLLEKVHVVPNTIEINRGSIMIITGPNAGGKTVTLKTTGIILLMAASGLHIPVASGSVIPKFKGVYTLIGDKQSIENRLSTFSAQINRLSYILKSASDNDFVLLDELAGGTEPVQGGALAQAVLEELSSNGITAVVTTHYSRLKALALLNTGFINASMGGNAVKPDYKLIKGAPGTSEGIKVAASLGLPDRVISRAREIAGDGDNRTDELLTALRKAKSSAEKERKELADEHKQIVLLKERQEELAREKEVEIKRLRKEGYIDMMEDIARLRRLFAHVEKKLRQVNTVKSLKQIKESVDKLEREVDRNTEQWFEKIDFSELKTGMKAGSKSLGKIVEIKEIVNENKIKASMGGMTLWLKLSDLYKPESGKKTETAKKQKRSVSLSPKEPPVLTEENDDPREPEVFSSSNTLDLRGKRVDDALSDLVRFLDSMILDNADYCKIIHGFGSGILKKAVREHLEHSPSVRKFRFGVTGEGGDGITVAYLI